MSPLSYDPKGAVAGPAAALTVAGLAAGLITGWARPDWGVWAGVAGAVLALCWLVKARWAPPLARLGLGLVVGAALAWVLGSLGIVPPGSLGR